MNYIIFDLEATCERDNKEFQNEIIEIGAVKINDRIEIVDTFDKFVKPKLNPILTDFCRELTTIKQDDVNNADTFPMVIESFKKWIGVSKENYILCSWGFYDKSQISKDSMLHRLNDSWSKKHISLKHQFADIKNVRPCGMEKALNILKLSLDGTHHRGIDDAINITKIFKACFGQWKFQ
jgi:inhibitor of KinA sporulation pathway (predicted exonuclease)